MKASRNPYRAGSAKRKAALAWLAERGITQPRPVHRPVPMPDATVSNITPWRKRAAV